MYLHIYIVSNTEYVFLQARFTVMLKYTGKTYFAIFRQ